LALVSPFILGHGYGTTDAALKELFSLDTLLLLIVLKIAASSIALAFRYGTRGLRPALLLGALGGGAFGVGARGRAGYMGDGSFSYGLYAIVGMGAVASAVLGAPISTILIIFELTGDYQITIALMISVVISNLITHHFLKSTSVFHMQLKQAGLDLEGGRARHVMRSTTVRTLMQENYATASTQAKADQIKDMLLTQNHDHIFILDESCRIIGSITLAEIRRSLSNGEGQSAQDLTAMDFCRDISDFLTPSDSLEDAFQKFDKSGVDVLPVVTDDAQAEIIGILYQKHVLRAYNKALIEEKE
jgi:CIC family chloride channel protein